MSYNKSWRKSGIWVVKVAQPSSGPYLGCAKHTGEIPMSYRVPFFWVPSLLQDHNFIGTLDNTSYDTKKLCRLSQNVNISLHTIYEDVFWDLKKLWAPLLCSPAHFLTPGVFCAVSWVEFQINDPMTQVISHRVPLNGLWWDWKTWVPRTFLRPLLWLPFWLWAWVQFSPLPPSRVPCWERIVGMDEGAVKESWWGRKGDLIIICLTTPCLQLFWQ